MELTRTQIDALRTSIMLKLNKRIEDHMYNQRIAEGLEEAYNNIKESKEYKDIKSMLSSGLAEYILVNRNYITSISWVDIFKKKNPKKNVTLSKENMDESIQEALRQCVNYDFPSRADIENKIILEAIPLTTMKDTKLFVYEIVDYFFNRMVYNG